MKLKSKTYTVLNLLPSTVAIAPGAFILSLGLNALIAVFPLIDALSSAWFIDSALAMARGERAVFGVRVAADRGFGDQISQLQPLGV